MTLHKVIGVLGITAISTASQATRLGKDNSVMVQDKYVPLRSYYGKSTLK